MQLQKEQQIDNKLKINKNLPENALEAVKPYFGPQNKFDWSIVKHTDNLFCDRSLMKLSNNLTKKKKERKIM